MLTMLPGSELDLNGLHLYIRDIDYQGGIFTNGDLISLLPGDANGNWKVDGSDLALWQQNYDPIGPGLGETVPEPTTMLLLGTGALCLAGFTRRRLMN